MAACPEIPRDVTPKTFFEALVPKILDQLSTTAREIQLPLEFVLLDLE